MLDAIKTFFQERICGAGGPEPLALASAALMFEVMRADKSVESAERARLRVLLRREYDLSTEDLQKLEALAEKEIGDGQLHQFTALVKEEWDLPKRIELVEKMWAIAWADGNVDGLEAKAIREVCDLLEVPEADFVAARKRAESRPRVPH